MRRLRSKQYGVPSEILWSKRPYLFPSRNPHENNWATWQRLAGRLTPVVRFCSSSSSPTPHATGPETRSSPTLPTRTRSAPPPAGRCRAPGSPPPLRPRAHTSASPGPSSGETHGPLAAPRPASGAGEFTPSTSPMRGRGSSGAGGSDGSGGPIL